MSNENFETALPETFDPQVEEGTHFDVLPVGTYVAQVIDASVSQPKSGDGHQVSLTWQITEGEHEGRYVWQRITLVHSSVQATKIGRAQFKDLCVATGVSEQVTDVGVFKFTPCRIKVGIEQDKQGIYPDKNRVSRILPLEDPKAGSKNEPKVVAKPAAATKLEPKAPAASAAAGNGTAPPWRKSAKPTSPGDAIDDTVPY
jgi:hypothetical protein